METRKSGLSARTEATLRRALEAERQRLVSDVRWSSSTAQALGEAQGEEGSSTGSPGDVASDLAGQELALTLAQVERRQLAEVERALRRMAVGRYGTCEACGGPIGLARLRALPWTEFCRKCVHAAAPGGAGVAAEGSERARPPRPEQAEIVIKRSGAPAPPPAS